MGKMNKIGAGARPFILSLLVATVIIFLIILFIQGFVAIKNPTSDIFVTSNGINSSMYGLANSLDEFTQVSDTIKTTFNGSQPSPLDYVFLIFVEAFTIPKATFSFIISSIQSIGVFTYNTLFIGAGYLYPNSIEILNLLLALLVSGVIFTAIFLLIKAIRGGESEGR